MRKLQHLPGLTLLTLALAGPLAALDSRELGLEPVYAKLDPTRTRVISQDELADALTRLPGWRHHEGVLYKVFVCPTFMDAIALLTRIAFHLQELDHHPELRNIYGKVYVGFTTYDQGKKITAHDVKAALAVEAALAGYPVKPLAGAAP